MPQEVEIKLRVPDLAEARNLLAGLGFRVHEERGLETNITFDTLDGQMRRIGVLLRLRSWREKSILTYKGPGVPGRHKSREEIELEIEDGGRFQEILERLGFRAGFCYEKYRTEFRKPDQPGIITIDETPIGDYLEIEGEPDWIDATARELGYTERDYITESYGGLFAAFRRQNPGAPEDMLFSPLK